MGIENEVHVNTKGSPESYVSQAIFAFAFQYLASDCCQRCIFKVFKIRTSNKHFFLINFIKLKLKINAMHVTSVPGSYYIHSSVLRVVRLLG